MSTTLTLLGTAAGPTPKVGRQAPSQVVTFDGAAYLIDCGNGVAPQMVRAGIPIGDLRAVFLTHQHSDHNADFGNLFLLGWSQLKNPVHLIGPPPLATMVDQFFEMHTYDISTRTVSEGRQQLRAFIKVQEISSDGVVYEDDHVRVTAAIVHHPPVEPAFGYRFDCADRSIVISGDTTRCDNLIRLARDADVLVHEAMYTAGIADRVGAYGAKRLTAHLLESHTSAEDAGAVAEQAGARMLVLSHLFPSDSSVDDSKWEAAARSQFGGEIVVGHDLLVI